MVAYINSCSGLDLYQLFESILVHGPGDSIIYSSVLDTSIPRMVFLSMIKWIVIIYFIRSACAQQCDQPVEAARFDCHPEPSASAENCSARHCCWTRTFSSTNSVRVDVPLCYYPLDFPNYRIIMNQSTSFGQRLIIVKEQSTYMPNEILNLTVDLFYETAQRFRIRIYDPANKRFEVPLEVPVIETKVNVTDYEVSLNQVPFAILIKRKSTGMTL